jgi:hypothetical protein
MWVSHCRFSRLNNQPPSNEDDSQPRAYGAKSDQYEQVLERRNQFLTGY